MSVLTLEAKLERVEPSTPWGFRMQGGKEFGLPLTILKVNPGSLASKCGLQQGDIILKIGQHDTDRLKHKEAQDFIITSGNKLDLLLQRIRERKRSTSKSNQGENVQQYIDKGSDGEKEGGSIPQPTYEKFAAPTITPSYQQSPVNTPSGGSQNYNTAAKPFGSTPSTPSSKTSYDANVNAVTQQTQNMSFTPKPVVNNFQSAAQKYADSEDKPPTSSQQSRSFRYLKDIIDSGQEPPSALRPAPAQTQVRSVSPQTVTAPSQNFNSKPRQFNSPSGLYSEESTAGAYKMQARTNNEEGSNSSDREFDEHGRKLYRPSETFKLIKEQETTTNKPDDDYRPAHSRTFKLLQEKLGAGDQQAPPPPAPPAPQVRPAPPPAAPAAPKPGVWTPPNGPGSKPFSPKVNAPVAPPAPGGPQGGPPKPTGVGAIRGKKGEAAIFKSGDSAPGGARIPVCASCGSPIRGPFVVALGKTWCPDCFVCANPRCAIKLLDIGFVEEGGYLYCERDYEQYFAPHCAKCGKAIVGECVNALQKTYCPSCFLCHHCKQPIGGNQFHLEDGNPYCEEHWRQMYQTMCKSCNFPIEPGDHWIEAMGSNFHSECFNCLTCQVNLEGQPFFAKGGKPYCKKHAR